MSSAEQRGCFSRAGRAVASRAVSSELGPGLPCVRVVWVQVPPCTERPARVLQSRPRAQGHPRRDACVRWPGALLRGQSVWVWSHSGWSIRGCDNISGHRKPCFCLGKETWVRHLDRHPWSSNTEPLVLPELPQVHWTLGGFRNTVPSPGSSSPVMGRLGPRDRPASVQLGFPLS